MFLIYYHLYTDSWTWTPDLKVAVRLPTAAVLPSDNNVRQVVHMHVPVIQAVVYKLIPVKRWWLLTAGKATAGLASHWACVTDLSGLSTKGVGACVRKGDKHRTCSPLISTLALGEFSADFIRMSIRPGLRLHKGLGRLLPKHTRIPAKQCVHWVVHWRSSVMYVMLQGGRQEFVTVCDREERGINVLWRHPKIKKILDDSTFSVEYSLVNILLMNSIIGSIFALKQYR